MAKGSTLTVSAQTAEALRSAADDVGAASVGELLRLAAKTPELVQRAYLEGLRGEVDARITRLGKSARPKASRGGSAQASQASRGSSAQGSDGGRMPDPNPTTDGFSATSLEAVPDVCPRPVAPAPGTTGGRVAAQPGAGGRDQPGTSRLAK